MKKPRAFRPGLYVGRSAHAILMAQPELIDNEIRQSLRAVPWGSRTRGLRGMHKNAISPASSLVDVIPRLRGADEYVRRLLGNMAACKKDHGNAFVRLGITGTGVKPH